MAGLLTSLFAPELRSAETSVSQYDAGFWAGAGLPTDSGAVVTANNSIQIGAVYDCVRILAESIAQLPLHLFRRLPSGGKEKAVNHPLYFLLHDLPNPEMDTFGLRETLMGHLSLRGNAYCEIEWGQNGYVKALWPLHPDRMTVARKAGNLVYRYASKKGQRWEFRAEQILHLRGLSSNGIMGMSPIAIKAELLGETKALAKYGAKFYANNGRPSGVLEYPGVLSKQAKTKLRQSWSVMHDGLENAHRVAVLEGGLKFNAIGVKPEEAQWLESRKFQKAEIFSMFRVPLHMGNGEATTSYSSVEQFGLEFVIYTLLPWINRFEKGFQRSLLLPGEQRSHFFKLLVDGLLRGDAQSRYTGYQQAFQSGWMSPNDIRELEDLNPIEGGDVYFAPLNMVPLQEVGDLSPAPKEEPSPQKGKRALTPSPSPTRGRGEQEARAAAAGRHRLMVRFRPKFAKQLRGLLASDAKKIAEAAEAHLGERDATSFRDWLSTYFVERHEAVGKQLRGVYTTYAGEVAGAAAGEVDGDVPEIDNWVRSMLAAFATRYGQFNRARVLDVIDGSDDPVAALDDELATWADERSVAMAQDEAVRSNGAVSKFVWAAIGIRKIHWVSFGESCPYCEGLSGKTVGIEKFFIDAGAAFTPEGIEIALRPSRNVGHPPVHGGCDCMVAAA